MLIRNVHLVVGRCGRPKTLVVNILIQDNKLEVVSRDPIPAEEGANAIDGREGYVLGNLVVGETPSFIILNQNPRENFEVLLDTSFFTVFAIHNGQLVSNNLFEVSEEEIKEEEEDDRRQGLDGLYAAADGITDELPGHRQVESLGFEVGIGTFRRGLGVGSDALGIAGRR